VKLNSQMKDLIKSLGVDMKSPLQLHPSLADIVNFGFVQVGDSIVLKALLPAAHSSSVSDFTDETGYECFVNHIHVEDYVPLASKSAALATGISLANHLETLLHHVFPNEEFEIIVSLEGTHCVVRFHKKRTGQQWLQDELDNYREEALMVFTV
jgi:hypothetical protein